MPQVSRNPLSHKDEEKILKTLHLILADITKGEEMQAFLFSFLTPTERLMLAKRLAIVILLHEGKDEEEITLTLNVTRPTVTKLKYFLESQGKGYGIAVKVLENEKLKQEVKNALGSIGNYIFHTNHGTLQKSY